MATALERRRLSRRKHQKVQQHRRLELHKIHLEGFRSKAHKQRYLDRIRRAPELVEKHLSWNDSKSGGAVVKSVGELRKERSRNEEVVQLDHLHQLNQTWLEDQEAQYISRREHMVIMHTRRINMLDEDYRSHFYRIEQEITSRQELRVETNLLEGRYVDAKRLLTTVHTDKLASFDQFFEAEVSRYTTVIKHRTDDWIACCQCSDAYIKACDQMSVAACSAFTRGIGVQHVNISHYGLGDQGLVAISKCLPQNIFIHTLKLEDNRLGDDGIETLVAALSAPQSLCMVNYLDVKRNAITAVGAAGLLRLASLPEAQARSLLVLDLSHNAITGNIATKLEQELSSYKCKLQRLDLSYNELDEACGHAIAEALTVNRALQHLSLRWNKIGDSCVAIAQSLVDNDVLESLDVGFCRCGDETASQVAKLLFEKHVEERTAVTGNNLQHLWLDHNRMGPDGVRMLAAMIGTNTRLRTLDISMNASGGDMKAAVVDLVDALASNSSLSMIGVDKALLPARLDLVARSFAGVGVSVAASRFVDHVPIEVVKRNHQPDTVIVEIRSEQLQILEAERCRHVAGREPQDGKASQKESDDPQGASAHIELSHLPIQIQMVQHFAPIVAGQPQSSELSWVHVRWPINLLPDFLRPDSPQTRCHEFAAAKEPLRCTCHASRVAHDAGKSNRMVVTDIVHEAYPIERPRIKSLAPLAGAAQSSDSGSHVATDASTKSMRPPPSPSGRLRRSSWVERMQVEAARNFRTPSPENDSSSDSDQSKESSEPDGSRLRESPLSATPRSTTARLESFLLTYQTPSEQHSTTLNDFKVPRMTFPSLSLDLGRTLELEWRIPMSV